MSSKAAGQVVNGSLTKVEADALQEALCRDFRSSGLQFQTMILRDCGTVDKPLFKIVTTEFAKVSTARDARLFACGFWMAWDKLGGGK